MVCLDIDDKQFFLFQLHCFKKNTNYNDGEALAQRNFFWDWHVVIMISTGLLFWYSQDIFFIIGPIYMKVILFLIDVIMFLKCVHHILGTLYGKDGGIAKLWFFFYSTVFPVRSF